MTKDVATNGNIEYKMQGADGINLGDDTRTTVELEYDNKTLIYGVRDNPPLHLLIFFTLQQGLLSLGNQLALAYMVADAACGGDDDGFRTQLVSSTLLMNGLTTIFMVLVGVRLPLFQGASYEYAVPLLALKDLSPEYCSLTDRTETFNSTLLMDNMTSSLVPNRSLTLSYIQSWMGSLMIVGAVHFIIGVTGLTGILLRFIGPVTIVPAILLIGIFLMKAALKFAAVHWGVSILVATCAIIFSLYLAKWRMPIPIWTKSKGFHIIRYPLHLVFAILFSMVIGWILCAILTYAGALTDDRRNPQYMARTDARAGVIEGASWFNIPYPGQFGPPSFSLNAFIGFMIATIISILDSIGDYIACAKTSRVPPPPPHAVNRGLAVEGFFSFVAGSLGCAHATTTNGGNIGALGLTKVVSRRIFLGVGIMYTVFAIFGKICAVFITIPYPVLGGALITMFGVFNGVVLSNLQGIALDSSRNMGIIGISLLVGLMVPHFIATNTGAIQTGNEDVDKGIIMLLGNANFAGAVLACFLDNTVPGTREERGMDTFLTADPSKLNTNQYEDGYEIYRLPVLHDRISKSWLSRLPFMPARETLLDSRED